MTFDRIQELFAEHYEMLREDSGENAPSSNVYFAASIQELQDDSGLRCNGIDTHLGDVSRPVVAVAVDCLVHDWVEIHDDVTDGQILGFFASCC